MARCGCGGSNRCNCIVTAGTNTTVSGTGSAANPYVISSTGGGAVTCDQVRPCLSAGPGAAYDPATGVISARLSGDAGNNLALGGDQGLYVPAVGGATIIVTDSDCIALSGDGSAGSPLTAQPVVDPAPGNLLQCGPSGLLVAGSVVATACGLTGNGSAGTPLAAAVSAWPYPCPVDANAGRVYCDSAGNLRSEPRARYQYFTTTLNENYANLPVPAAGPPGTLITTRELVVTNPDTCHDAIAITSVEVDVDSTSRPGQAAYFVSNDEMYRFENRGSAAVTDVHTQTVKVLGNTVIPAGGSVTVQAPINLGQGAGGATYNRIQSFIRAMVFAL